MPPSPTRTMKLIQEVEVEEQPDCYSLTFIRAEIAPDGTILKPAEIHKVFRVTDPATGLALGDHEALPALEVMRDHPQAVNPLLRRMATICRKAMLAAVVPDAPIPEIGVTQADIDDFRAAGIAGKPVIVGGLIAQPLHDALAALEPEA